MRPIFLCGFMGCGKSTVGRILARRLKCRCVDLDDYIEKQEGMTIVTPNYEGVRAGVVTKDGKGWILVRQSLHDPEIPVNIESKQKGGTAAILALVEPFFARYDRLRRK